MNKIFALILSFSLFFSPMALATDKMEISEDNMKMELADENVKMEIKDGNIKMEVLDDNMKMEISGDAMNMEVLEDVANMEVADDMPSVTSEEVDLEELTDKVANIEASNDLETAISSSLKSSEAKTFGAIAIFIFILIIAFSIWALVFWIMMVVHNASNEVNNKAAWLIAQVLLGILASIVYYFAVKRPFEANKSKTQE